VKLGRGLVRDVGDDLLATCLESIDAAVGVLDEAIYSVLRDEALARSQ